MTRCRVAQDGASLAEEPASRKELADVL
jgi:hypothetical protein